MGWELLLVFALAVVRAAGWVDLHSKTLPVALPVLPLAAGLARSLALQGWWRSEGSTCRA